MYWFNKFDEARDKGKAAKKPWFNQFVNENIVEVPMSAFACGILVVLGNDIPVEVFDFHSRGSTLLVGYSSSSILNGILSRRLINKPNISTIEIIVLIVTGSQLASNILYLAL